MPLILPGNVGSATAATGFNVANSCRFDGSSSYMQKTYANGQNKKFSISTWIKRSSVGDAGAIWSGYHNGTNYVTLAFIDDDTLRFQNVSAGVNMHFATNRVFRDVSAWYHILAIVDTTDGTAGDRQQIFINGVRETSFSTSTAYAEDDAAELGATDKENIVGRHGSDDDYFDGYMAEHVFIDGLALAADQFGEFDSDSGIWKPIDVSGLTFGTNGYYLDFEASGNLGNDANGGTDLTESGLAATDQSIDTCTNNFATMNPLDNFYQGTAFSEGNLKLVYTSGNRTWNTCNVALSSGKWYCEILKGETNNDTIGIHYKLSAGLTDRPDSDGGAWSFLGGKNYDNGGVKTGGSTITYTIAASDSGDIVQLFLDLDNNKVYFGVNGTVAHSGVGIDIPAVSTLGNGQYYIFGGSDSTSETMTHTWNFGSPAVALSSGVTDANGFGNFEYTPSGTFDSASKDFLAICTKNLAGNS